MTAINEGVPRVFLDTEVFVHENFNYNSPRFRSLMTLALAGRIQVFLTDLTLREIEANIRSRVNEAVVSIRPNAVLRNSGLPRVRALFEKLDVARIQEELVSQLEKYLKAAKVTVLKVPPIVLPLVLDAYFERQPPFGVGKKKAEFPDALVLETLREWCVEHESNMAIVSRDEGVKVACDGNKSFHHFDDIAKYLDAFFASNAALSLFVRKMILEAHDPIFAKTKDAFPYLGAILVDEDGEVDGIELGDIVFGEEPADFEIISLDSDKAEVELAVSMTFIAELSYKEPGTGTWDSEEKRLVFENEIDTTVTQDIEGTIVVEVCFKSLDAESFEVTRVLFPGHQDICVYANHHGGEWMG